MLALGVVCLALAVGMGFGLSLPTVGASLGILKFLAQGIGGVMPPVPALMFLWLGGLLCVSARRHVSFRLFLAFLAFLLCLSAFLTLIARAPGFPSMLDYCRNVNRQRVSSPESYGEFISCAYQRYYTVQPFQDGGAMGMLLAYPAWRLLGAAGGAVLMAFAALTAFSRVIGVNPVRLMLRPGKQGAGPGLETERPDRSRELRPEPAQQEQPVPGAAVQDQRPEALEPREPAPAAVVPQTLQPQVRGPVPPAGFQRAPDPLTADWPSLYPEGGSGGPTGAQAIPQPPLKGVSEIPVQPVPDTGPEPLPVAADAGIDTPGEALPAAASNQQTIAPPGRESRRENGERPNLKRGETVSPTASGQPAPGSGTAEASGRKTAQAVSGGGVERRLDGTPALRPPPEQLRMSFADYEGPPVRLLSPPREKPAEDSDREDAQRGEKLLQTLRSFGIEAHLQHTVHGPAITRFAIRLGEGVNIQRVRNLMGNLAVELQAKSPLRAEYPIPGTSLIGIEVSNAHTETVTLSEVLFSPKMLDNRSPSAVALGKDITGAPVFCELMDMPHLLIAGATGSGKSVCINSIITSLLYRSSPEDVRLILIDPKYVELQPYNDIPHLMLPVITDPKKAVAALDWVCREMDERYRTLNRHGVRNLDAYNRRVPEGEEKIPRIILVVDEMADLMMVAGKAVDEHIRRITAKARAAGICLILATQRPSVDVLTGVIKSNIPSRIAFQVAALVDSRTILDGPGAENLLGFGDMLYLPRTLPAPRRIQGCFVSDEEVQRITDYVKSRNQTRYNPEVIEHLEKEEGRNGGRQPPEEGLEESTDELLPTAIEMAVEAGQISISMLQRVLRVGYGRAGRLIDEMEKRGIISANEGTKPRKALITREEYGGLPKDA